MTIARAIIRPGKWTARNDTWPKVDLTYVEPIRDAYFDWAADQLPLGSLTQWSSLIDNSPLLADGGAPQVVNSGGKKAVRFNGSTNRMRVLTPNVPAAHTVVTIFRLLTPEYGDAAVFDYASSGAGAVFVASDALRIEGRIAGLGTTLDPAIPADTNWHIAILTSNGANSALRIDEVEAAKSVTSTARQGITLGFNHNSADSRAHIEYRRNIIMPPLNATERAALYSKLKTAYGI
ncbi:hypothetical protein AA310_01815 [Arthrobacter sp. YC-RL1]|uniref:hypothetical protein n=1 Tax=Arthrobacter sp. YC-RL1 TaxID=1652545 RepID=UPI00063D9E3E|nr:hypothetical protein [Arthrobacter sp. YC-RL1]ALQ31830.1 hypothetical protein ATC04_15625 [Arthrobacter sp. YC-RL1]KLI90145.1 hypothetical protein AA310_01815 [Arthrobacter sp. YC-RL1]